MIRNGIASLLEDGIQDGVAWGGMIGGAKQVQQYGGVPMTGPMSEPYRVEPPAQQALTNSRPAWNPNDHTDLNYRDTPLGPEGVWTGQSYQQVPTFNNNQIGMVPAQEEIRHSGYDGNEGPIAQYARAAQMGILDPSALGALQYANSNNFQWKFGEDGAPSVRVKSGDKAGTWIPYSQQNGQWVPDYGRAYEGEWDTNRGIRNANRGMATVFGSALAGGALAASGAFGAGAGAGTGGAVAGAGAGMTAAEAAALGAEAIYGGGGSLLGGGSAITAGELAGLGAAGLGAAGAGTAGTAGVTMPTVTIMGTAIPTAGMTAAEIAALTAAAGSGITSLLPDGAPGEGGPSIDQRTDLPDGAPGEGGPSIDQRVKPVPSLEELAKRFGSWVWDNPQKALALAGALGSVFENSSSSGGSGSGSGAPGWNGPIAGLAALQTMTPAPAGYRPGFSPEHVYSRTSYVPGAANAPQTSGSMTGGGGITGGAPLPDLGTYPERFEIDPEFAFIPSTARSDPVMEVGIGSLRKRAPMQFARGGITTGLGDGMSDHIPATIEGQQPAVLSKNEFVLPADIVSHLGNGSTEAGAQVLYRMMDRIRQARTGNKQQARQINPAEFLP